MVLRSAPSDRPGASPPDQRRVCGRPRSARRDSSRRQRVFAAGQAPVDIRDDRRAFGQAFGYVMHPGGPKALGHPIDLTACMKILMHCADASHLPALERLAGNRLLSDEGRKLLEEETARIRARIGG